MEKTMNFGGAIAAIKEGKRVSRMGWNGKGMYLFAFPGMKVSMTMGCEIPDDLNFKHHLLKLQFDGSDDVEILPSIVMKTADNKVLVGWLASQTDMLSEDWVIVE